jgi:6-phosphogluconolactonase
VRPALQVFDDPMQLARGAALEILERSHAALAARGEFQLVLAGGSTPRATYAELARGAQAGELERWEVWFGDERCVPPGHEASNFRMAREAWLGAAPIPPGRVHRIRGEDEPGAAAEDYQRELLQRLGPSPRFDLVLLGLGRDGHVASLFPGAPALRAGAGLVSTARSPLAPEQRVTLTPAAINAARAVLFLVSGADKAPALAALLARRGTAEELPALAIAPAQELLCFVDRAALAPAAGQD